MALSDSTIAVWPRLARATIALVAILVANPVLAECGGTTQCIGVGATAGSALTAHHGGTATFTMAFGSQNTATTSASQTAFVAAVIGPATTMAVLGPIAISGINAADFSIAGGTCSTTNGPVHGGTQCTIAIAFTPTSAGAKTATVTVPLNPPACPTCITGRAFTVTGTGIGGAPAPAPVAAARLDPAARAAVIATVASQMQTGQRFAQAQRFNYQQRMEGLRARSATPAPAGAGAGRLRSASGSGTGFRAPADPFFGRASPAQSETDRLARRPDETASPLTELLRPLVQIASTGGLNLSHSTDRVAGILGGDRSTNLWIAGNVSFGSRDPDPGRSGLRFSTDGISVGIDRRTSDKLVLGLGIGIARGNTELGTDESRNRSSGLSLSLYGTYRPTEQVFVDGLLGAGLLRHEMRRFVAGAPDFARADRRGAQLFGSLATGYEFRQKGLLFSPYARGDFSVDRLREATETGAGTSNLVYQRETFTAAQLALGLRAESVHRARFGWVYPAVRVEVRQTLKNDHQSSFRYADQATGPTYTAAVGSPRQASLLLGIGSEFALRGGTTLGVDYQYLSSGSHERSNALQFWLSQNLEGKSARQDREPSTLFTDPLRVEVAYLWDSNLSRALASDDRLADGIYDVRASKGLAIPLTTHTRFVVTAGLGGEKHQRFHRLDRFSGDLQGELQYRSSGAFDAVTLSLFARGAVEEIESSLRSGTRSSFGVSARRSLTDRIDLFGALAQNGRDAQHPVFDGRDLSARLNIDYSLARRGTLYLSGELRRGDAVSSGSASAQALAISKISVDDDAFAGRGLTAYRVDAHTRLVTIGYNMPLGPRDALDFSWRQIDTVPERQSGIVPPGTYGFLPGGFLDVGKTRYRVDQFSLVYLMRF